MSISIPQLPHNAKEYTILQGDVRERLRDLPDGSVHMVCTSPPYWGLRSYSIEPQVWGGDIVCTHHWGDDITALNSGGGWNDPEKRDGYPTMRLRDPAKERQREVSQGAYCRLCGAWRGDLGLEPTPGEFVQHMVEIFRDVRRVLRRDGVMFLNLGDSYANAGQTGNDRRGTLHEGGKPRYTPVAGLKHKDLVMMPARVALALQADGWWLRDDMAWVKAWQDEDNNLEGNTMPGSQEDRFTSAWEHVFLLTKSERYFFDLEAVKTNSGATPRNVLRVNPQGFKEAHFATFPPALVAPLIKAGTSERGVCPECGGPWRRVVERGELVPDAPGYKPRGRPHTPDGLIHVGMTPQATGGKSAPNHHYEKNTTGWQPTCKCGRTDTVPATVLDPFSGAGTTCLVALRLGRRAVGIELNQEYIEMSHKRIQGDPQAMNLNMELVEMEESA